MRDANLQVNKKNSFTHRPSCTSPSFSQNTSQLYLPTRPWKFESTISFWKCKRKVVLLVISMLIQQTSQFSRFHRVSQGFTALLTVSRSHGRFLISHGFTNFKWIFSKTHSFLKKTNTGGTFQYCWRTHI